MLWLPGLTYLAQKPGGLALRPAYGPFLSVRDYRISSFQSQLRGHPAVSFHNACVTHITPTFVVPVIASCSLSTVPVIIMKALPFLVAR